MALSSLSRSLGGSWCLFVARVIASALLFAWAPMPAAAQTATTQSIVWSDTYAGPAGHGVLPLELLGGPAGQLYGIGTVYDASDLPTVGSQIVVVRYAADGLRLWEVLVPADFTEAADAAVDGAGNVLVVGRASDLDEIVLAKVSPAGVLEWTRTLARDPALPQTVGSAVAVDPSGTVYLVGAKGLEGGVVQAVIQKYASDGTLLWSITDDTYEGFRPQAAVADADALYLAGGQEVTAGDVDMAILRLLADGTPDWLSTHTMGGEGVDDQALALRFDGSGAIVALGYFTDVERLIAVIKLGSDGATQLERRIISQPGFDLFPLGFATGSRDQIAVAGIIEGGGHDETALVIVISSNGDFEWSRSYSYFGVPTEDRFEDVVIGPDDSVYVTGHYQDVGSVDEWVVLRHDAQGTLRFFDSLTDPAGQEAHGRALILDAQGRMIVSGSLGEGIGDLVTVALADSLLVDDFEDGTLDAWSVVVP